MTDLASTNARTDARSSVRRAAVAVAVALLAASSLSACNAWRRLASIGEEPQLSPIENPKSAAEYRPVSMPMPTPVVADRKANSLWRPGARAFFKDQRASQVGDIVTVVISTADSAVMQNRSRQDRRNTDSTESAMVMLGFEQQTRGWLPRQFDPTNPLAIDFSADRNNGGSINRAETVRLRVAAVVTQMLPNGNMVVFGRQEMRVNAEVRELTVSGVIRPEDISVTNAVSLDQMAEARVAYGGRGQLTDYQQPRYGTQLLDILLPF
ncbi:MAG: flagellar basal body L-ring protein FlgH [Alphaproteobacteria bacterium]|nr:flagellar basal body L-ring protein FlgH [Alphaproteobacteria bacterium]